MVGLDPQGGDGEQGEARVRQRDHRPELDHLGQLPELWRATGQRDHGRDRDGADDRRGRSWRANAASHSPQPGHAVAGDRALTRSSYDTTAISAKFARLNATLIGR